MERFRVLTPTDTFVWRLTGWPYGDFDLTLTLESRYDPMGTPAVVIDLGNKVLLDFIRLEPFLNPHDWNHPSQIFISCENVGLSLWFEEDRFMLFRITGNILPNKMAVIETTPHPDWPDYAGVISYAVDAAW